MSQHNQAQEYAQAVYALALEGWQKALVAVGEKLAAAPDILAELNNTQTSFADRQAQLDALLPDALSGQMRNFFYTLLKNGHLDQVAHIARSLTRLTEKGPDLETAKVTTAVALSDDEQAQFRQKLAAQADDNLEIDFLVDASILGGAIVQLGDKIIDGSIASKLNSIQEQLKAI
jgi:F-type H+-transporting ATPase subunit delta